MRVTVEPESIQFMEAVPVDAIAIGLENGGDGDVHAVVVGLESDDGSWHVYRTSACDAREIAHALLQKAALLDAANLKKGLVNG